MHTKTCSQGYKCLKIIEISLIMAGELKDINGNHLEKEVFYDLGPIGPQRLPLFFKESFSGKVIFTDFKERRYSFTIEQVSLNASRYTSEALENYLKSLDNLKQWIEEYAQTQPLCTEREMSPSDDEAHYQEGLERELTSLNK